MPNYFTFKGFLLGFTLIAISGCTAKSNKTSEIITIPTFPEKFSNIPLLVENSGLKELRSSSTLIKSIKAGRSDPFLPPSYQSVKAKPAIPNSFKFIGLISTEKSLSAFVSFDNHTGTIKKGDIGGETTKLLPKGWVVSNLNKDTEILQLDFKNFQSRLKLMPEKKLDIKY